MTANSICVSLSTNLTGVNYLLAALLSVYVVASILVTNLTLGLNAMLGRITFLHAIYLVATFGALIANVVAAEGLYGWAEGFTYMKLMVYFGYVPVGYLTSLGWSEYFLALKHVCLQYPEECTTVEGAVRRLRRLKPKEGVLLAQKHWLRFKIHKLWIAARYGLTGPCMLVTLPVSLTALVPNALATFGMTFALVYFIFSTAGDAADQSSALDICFPNRVSLGFTIVSWALDSVMFTTLFATDGLDVSCDSLIRRNMEFQRLNHRDRPPGADISDPTSRVKEENLFDNEKTHNDASGGTERNNPPARTARGGSRPASGNDTEGEPHQSQGPRDPVGSLEGRTTRDVPSTGHVLPPHFRSCKMGVPVYPISMESDPPGAHSETGNVLTDHVPHTHAAPEDHEDPLVKAPPAATATAGGHEPALAGSKPGGSFSGEGLDEGFTAEERRAGCAGWVWRVLNPRRRFRSVQLRWRVLVYLVLHCQCVPLLWIHKLEVVSLPILLFHFVCCGFGTFVLTVGLVVFVNVV